MECDWRWKINHRYTQNEYILCLKMLMSSCSVDPTSEFDHKFWLVKMYMISTPFYPCILCTKMHISSETVVHGMQVLLCVCKPSLYEYCMIFFKQIFHFIGDGPITSFGTTKQIILLSLILISPKNVTFVVRSKRCEIFVVCSICLPIFIQSGFIFSVL